MQAGSGAKAEKDFTIIPRIQDSKFRIQDSGLSNNYLAGMPRIERFEDLEIWKLARAVANQVYDATLSGPFSHDYALRDQIRRAVISIFSNIAEGFERNGNKEFLQFLSVAKASCGEVRTQLTFAGDRGYISTEVYLQIEKDLFSLSNQIGGFCKYLRGSDFKGMKFTS